MTPPAIPGWICEEAIGHGADATVWRAQPTAGGAAVALKVIPLARLRDPAAHLREAWAAGSTGCRQVVAVHDAGQHGDCAWLAMELASEDAAMLTARCGGRLRPATAARIARDVARGLQALADHGFVHRDVKPSNILLRADGSAMIGDLAPLRGGGTATRSADLSGTPAYLSPEQIRGSAPDVRSDVHALGATIFALIAGRPPFAADGALDLLRAIAETPAPDLRSLVPDVPPAIADVVATALAKDPMLRQQRPAHLAAELDEALAGRTPSRVAAPAVRTVQAEPFIWPAWLPYAAAVIAALGGLVLGVAASRPSRAGLAADAASAEAAALRHDVLRTQAAREALSGLQLRLERLRQERDAAAMRRAVAAQASPARAVEAAPVPAAVVATPPAAPAIPPAPAASTAPPQPIVVALKPVVSTPMPPAALPPARDPPPVEAEPGPDLPRIQSVTVAARETICGCSVNPLAVRQMVAWNRYCTLWRSDDRGATWTKEASPAPKVSNYTIGSRITISSSGTSNAQQAQWLGALGFIPGSSRWVGWLSRDGGQSWREVPPPTSVIELESSERPTLSAVTADGTIYAAGKIAGQRRTWRLFATSDAGASWRDVADLQADRLVLHPAASRLLLLAGNGPWQASLDLGRTWVDILVGSHDKGPWQVSGSRLHLLSWRAGMSILDLASGLWSTADMAQPPGGDITCFAVDPRDPRTAFAVDPRSGLIRTTDQGRTWRRCALPSFSMPSSLLIVGARRPRLYCSNGDGIASLDLTAPCDDLFTAPLAAP